MDTVDSPVDEPGDAVASGNEGCDAVDAVDNPVDLPIDVPLPIEELPAVAPRRRVAPARDAPRRPIYHRLRYGAHRCDDCMRNHQTDPHSPLALLARYERVVLGEGVKLLCIEHVQHWRDRDGLPPVT